MKPHNYKAAICGIGDVDVVALPYRECSNDDVIVRNILTGGCGSDGAAYRHGGDDNMIWVADDPLELQMDACASY